MCVCESMYIWAYCQGIVLHSFSLLCCSCQCTQAFPTWHSLLAISIPSKLVTFCSKGLGSKLPVLSVGLQFSTPQSPLPVVGAPILALSPGSS